MSERSEDRELTALESALRELRPKPETIDRAVLMYRAGRAATRAWIWPAAPRIHQQTTCRIEPTLLDRLIHAVKTLRQYAHEKNWTPDWKSYEEHAAAAEDLHKKEDLPSAFREYCRALLPLTRALSKQRNKEEHFRPFWDETA